MLSDRIAQGAVALVGGVGLALVAALITSPVWLLALYLSGVLQ